VDKHDFSVFNHPRIFYAEKRVGAAASATQTAYFEQNDLKVSRDFLLDYIWIGENTFPYYANVDLSLIRSLMINWQIVDRAPIWPMEDFPVSTMQNHWEADRSWNPCGVRDSQDPQYCTLLTRHGLRWTYNPTNDVRIDWEVAGGQVNRRALTVNPMMIGTSLKTGHRRVFGLSITYPATVAPTDVFSGTTSTPNTMGNLGDDPYLMEEFGFTTGSDWQTILPATFGDLRWLNLLKMKVAPSQGEGWSDVAIPLAVYALHQSVAGRWVTFRPPGGPMLMKAGQSFVARIRNTSAFPTNAQIALIGRTAPGIGSLGV
jgi:hypothetical protein